MVQEQVTAGEETSQGQWCCRNRKLGNARGVSGSCESFSGLVLVHSLQPVSFQRPFLSFSKVIHKVVVQLYGGVSMFFQCPHNSNHSLAHPASAPASVQCCRSGSLVQHLLFWYLPPLCTSGQFMPGFLTSPKGGIAAPG